MIDYTLFLVMQGAAFLGTLAGMMGVFALLRQQSLLGDAISHAALPGIIIMFLCTYSKNPWILLSGGACAGIIGVWIMNTILANTRLKKDTVLGILLSVFFGLGLVLMTITQKYACADQAIINKFLFGTIATLLPVDLLVIKVMSVMVILLLVVFWKECTLYIFDAQLFHLFGFSRSKIEFLLTMLLIVTIVVGLQTVGVVLMSSMLIAPAAAARQWTKHVGTMVLLAGFFGCISAMTGVYVSSIVEHLPTGPTIVVIASVIVFISLLCAPKRRIAL